MARDWEIWPRKLLRREQIAWLGAAAEGVLRTLLRHPPIGVPAHFAGHQARAINSCKMIMLQVVLGLHDEFTLPDVDFPAAHLVRHLYHFHRRIVFGARIAPDVQAETNRMMIDVVKAQGVDIGRWHDRTRFGTGDDPAWFAVRALHDANSRAALQLFDRVFPECVA